MNKNIICNIIGGAAILGGIGAFIMKAKNKENEVETPDDGVERAEVETVEVEKTEVK